MFHSFVRSRVIKLSLTHLLKAHVVVKLVVHLLHRLGLYTYCAYSLSCTCFSYILNTKSYRNNSHFNKLKLLCTAHSGQTWTPSVFPHAVSSVKFLARPSCLLVHDDWDHSYSPYMQILELRVETDPRILGWTKRKTGKYSSADILNEMIKTMAFQILCKTAASLHTTQSHTTMANETTNMSHCEQGVVYTFTWLMTHLRSMRNLLVFM